MKAHFSALILFILFSLAASAQTDREDVIYLKNGSIYRGSIIEQVPGVSYKIEIAGGSVIVIKAEDVEKVTKEEKAYPPDIKDSSGRYTYIWDDRRDRYIKRRTLPPYGYKDKGGFLQIQFNGQFAGGGARLIGGYKINQFAMLGIGFGLGGIVHGANHPYSVGADSDPYGGFYAPFFLYYSGDILKRNITPFYAAEFGYGLASSPLANGDAYYGATHNTSGGVMGSAGFGMRFYAGRKFVCSLSLALDMQQAHTHVFSYATSTSPELDYTSSMVMLLPAFKIGLGFVK